MTCKLRFLYAAKAAHPAGAVFATLRLADFCLALTASQTLIRGSLEIEKRYELTFLEVGTDEGCVHLLVQSVPMCRVKKIVQLVKRLMSRERFRCCSRVKQMLWGGEFWRDGYFAGSVGKPGDEAMIGKYVKNQGGNCQEFHSDHPLALF